MRYLLGLRAQILIWTILPLSLILIFVSVGSINLHQMSMRDMVAERDKHLAGLAAERMDDQIRMRATALETILSGVGETENLSQDLAKLEPALAFFDQGLQVYEDNQVPLTADSPILSEYETEIQKIIKAAGASPNTTVHQLVSNPQKPWLLFMARTDAISRRTVVGGVSQAVLIRPELFKHINQNPRREAYVLAPDGRVIYHSDQKELYRDYRIHPGVEQALRGEAGSTFAHLAGEEEHVVGYAPVKETGWVLLVEEPWADVIMPALQYTLWAPLLVLVAAVASLSAIHFGLRRVIQPLQVLGREASRLAWGDFQAIQTPVGGIDEIHDLQSTLQEMAAQINRYQEGMHDYIAVLTQTQEEERRRLARELHDVIVQTVIALGQRVKIMQLNVQEQFGANPTAASTELDRRLSELAEMIRRCLEDVRGLIRDLRPIYLEELGLIAALEALTRSPENGDIQATFEVIGEEQMLPRDTNLAVYRIAQAAMHNALRHGQPDFISVQVSFEEAGIVLTVEDNGAGFVPPERPSDLALNGHFGLVGMYERVTRLGGHLSIRSAPGAGTTIVAFLPYTVPGEKEQASFLDRMM